MPPPVNAHPEAKPGIWLVWYLEDDRSCQDVQGHRGYLRHVSVSLVRLYCQIFVFLLLFGGHARHDGDDDGDDDDGDGDDDDDVDGDGDKGKDEGKDEDNDNGDDDNEDDDNEDDDNEDDDNDDADHF